MNKTLAGVYVHLPICDVKCSYCDFYSIGRRHVDAEFWTKYLKRLKEDFLEKVTNLPQGAVLGSIFFGGGTPSRAPGFVFQELISLIQNTFAMKTVPFLEISAEVNPESFTLEKATALKIAGVNRINIGIQTRDTTALRYMGRVFSKRAYEQCLEIASRVGFKHYGIDLIHGVPGLSWRQVEKDIQWAVASGVTHISAYSLTIEPKTALEKQINLGFKKRPSEKRQILHYNLTQQLLSELGYQQYEVSNYARKGCECKHNMIYWKYRPYIGIGAGAHSFTGALRIAEPRSVNMYLSKKGQTTEQAIHHIDYWIGATRLLKVQSLTLLKKSSQMHLLKEIEQRLVHLSNEGLVKILSGQRFYITKTGIRFADTILSRLTSDLNLA